MSVSKLAENGAHLFRLTSRGVAELVRDYANGDEEWWINVDRNVDSIYLQDPVFVWATGRADKAGIVALGFAGGEFDELEHPKSYNDPDGATALRSSAQVFWWWAQDTPMITRAEMEQMPLFAEFELFQTPRKQNAFAVTPEQAHFLIEWVREVAGEPEKSP